MHPEDSTAGTVLTALLLSSMLAAFASMVVRFRRSRSEERQQLEWVTYAAALVPFVAVGDFLPEVAGNLLFTALIAFLPVAAGIARGSSAVSFAGISSTPQGAHTDAGIARRRSG